MHPAAPIAASSSLDVRARSPRIAILGSRGIPASYGGFETFVEELSRRLVRLGVDVTVFCEATAPGAASPDLDPPSEIGGVHLEYVRPRGPRPARSIWYDVASLWRARGEYDVVYMLGYGASLFCFLPRLAGSEVWINMDGLEWRRSKWGLLARTWLRTMEGLATRTATRLVFDNGALADEVRARRGSKTPSTVLEYGAPVVTAEPDPEPLARYDLEAGGYWLVVCRFEPENHILEIIRGYGRTRSERPLVIVANTDLGTSYARETLAHKSARVRFLGPIYDPSVLVPLRSHCFGYLHGHGVGGTNPSLLEAMGCANLVIAHDNPFNRETLDGTGLFFADEGEVGERIEAAERMESDERAELSGRARARVADHYDWDRIARSYRDLIVAAAAARASREGPRT